MVPCRDQRSSVGTASARCHCHRTTAFGGCMNNIDFPALSRRRFLVTATLSAAAVVFAPRRLFAQETGIVPTMVNAASRAPIEIHPLRRNIDVLECSGGNLAVLTGQYGKL